MNFRKEFETHLTNFSDNYPDIKREFEKSEMHNPTMNLTYWYTHIYMLTKLGVEEWPKDTSILDLGTQMGVVPHYLKEIGFTDVSASNSKKEAGDTLEDLEIVWSCMDLNVQHLHIKPEEEFTLDKKYDIILGTHINIHWNMRKMLKIYNSKILTDNYYVRDKHNNSHTYFVPYNTSELKFFIENIKKYLTPTGKALINFHPFPYWEDRFKEELDLLKEHCEVGHCDSDDILFQHSYIIIEGDK